MLIIRLYIVLLTLIFFALSFDTGSIGILQAIVVTCAPVFLILYIRNDVEDIMCLEAQSLH